MPPSPSTSPIPTTRSTASSPASPLGGPIAANRAWFYGAYLPQITTYDRTVNASTAQNPIGEVNSNERTAQMQYATANVTSQMSDHVRARVAFNNSWRRNEGLLPSLQATDPAGSDYAKTSTFPN